MSLLAGPAHDVAGRGCRYWLAALAGALLLHCAMVLVMVWQPPQSAVALPSAAPFQVEIAVLASPVVEPTELPEGPVQQASATMTEPVADKPPVEPEPAPHEVPEAPPEVTPDVAIERAEEPVEPEVASVPDTVTPRQKEDVRKDEASEQTEVAESAASDKSAPETTAPVAMPTQRETVSAPASGALAQQAKAMRASWQSRLQAHLERLKRYPRQARMRQQEGVPWVNFTIDREGRVIAAELYRPSGMALLDREALALVHRAEPMPPPPPEVDGELLTLTVPVEFFMMN